jgi:uncharacterized protein DUF1028
MLAAFDDRASEDLGARLIAALQAGLAAGGEVSPVRSAGMVIAESEPWPVTDLRVDWHDDPVGQLAGLWRIWQPQAASYISRALRPSGMARLSAAWRPGLPVRVKHGRSAFRVADRAGGSVMKLNELGADAQGQSVSCDRLALVGCAVCGS